MVLEKAEEPEIKLPTSAGSLKKQESSRKTSISLWALLRQHSCHSLDVGLLLLAATLTSGVR